MDWAKATEHVLPPLMHDPVTFAVPFFLVLLVIEWAAARKLAHTETERAPSGAYLRPDAWASIWMGVVSIGTSAVMNGIALIGYAALYVYVAPWQLPSNAWYTWVIAILGVDFLYYWYHRMAHRVRLFWATHQAHHSSQYFNLATALRQKWNISGDVFLRALLPLFGVPPWMVFASFSINLVYQYWIHTERIGKLWRPIEFVFNTPSHHRVHHGMDEIYLDRNYGGILIIWDRLFRSFQPEEFRPHYGLTKQVDTYNIWTLQTHEYVAIARDLRGARRWRDRSASSSAHPAGNHGRRCSPISPHRSRCRNSTPHAGVHPVVSRCENGVRFPRRPWPHRPVACGERARLDVAGHAEAVL